MRARNPCTTCNARTPRYSDGAVRRFIVKVGRHALDDLFALREADNIGSGLPGDAGGLADLRTRVAAQLAANVALVMPAA